MCKRTTNFSFWLLLAAPCVSVSRALLLLEQLPPTPIRRRITAFRHPPTLVSSRQRPPSLVVAAAFVQKDFDLDGFAAELEASLQIAREALEDAQASSVDDLSGEFPTNMLLREIDDAMAFANQVVEDLQQEKEEYKQQVESSEGIDADAILGDKSNQVVEYLSKGFMNADSFQDFCKERTETTLLIKESTVKQARIIAYAKAQEANRLKKEIQRTAAKRAKAEATIQAVTIGLDGCLLGCAIGLFLWAAIPEYLGDNIDPSVPSFIMGGLVACASIMASTSDTIAALAMEKVNFGCISRTILSIIASIVRFLVSIPDRIASKIAEQQNEWEDELEEYRKKKRR